ncbi:MAG TPA: hypothetical protein VNG69_07650 [Casimicrobiaceae bacterium]|nr:hypothetical protein [Casimicrobiaceae bacterium]
MDRATQLKRGALTAALALCFAAPAFAQGGGGSNSMQNPNNPTSNKHGTSAGTTSPQEQGVTSKSGTTGSATTTSSAAGGAASGAASANTTRGAPDNTNSKVRTNADMNSWVKGYAGDHKGRISRQAYLDEMGRRWDAMDRSNEGLTPAEVSRLTGKVDVSHSAVPRTGSDVQAGNMGPTNVKK